MNDSFLEDLHLTPTNSKRVATFPADRHITTRPITSTPLDHLAENKLEHLESRKVEHAPLIDKQAIPKLQHAKDSKKLSDHDARKLQSKSKVSEKKEKSTENKLKPIENEVKNVSNEQAIREAIKKWTKDAKVKVSEKKVIVKERARCSGNYKENSYTSNVSRKENSHPSDSSKEGSIRLEACKEKERKCKCTKKSEVKEDDSAALLSAVKELLDTNMKQESTRILTTIQELHMNSQATLIKNLLLQTDELIQELHPNKDSGAIRMLVEQNHKLQETTAILQIQNEDLVKKLKDFEMLKQENMALKLKYKELMNAQQ